jgi:hypothetical protein
MSTNSLTLVAEVVLSVMGNRSDRRLPNLSCACALEIFPSGPGASIKLLTEAHIWLQTVSPSTRQTPFARGWVHSALGKAADDWRV